MGCIKMKFCGEIAYSNNNDSIHSDICYRCVFPEDNGEMISNTHRKFLHEVLDEWLDKSNSTGIFWLGDGTYFDDAFVGTRIEVID